MPVDDSLQSSTFIVANADGYPELNSTNSDINTAINQNFISLVDSWQCQSGGESKFKIEDHNLGLAFLSVEYTAIQLCDGMLSPASTNSAVTYSMVDASEIALESITQCSSVDHVEQKFNGAITQARIKDCPKPHFSGDYYLDKSTVTLMNFYPLHMHSSCEFKIVKQIPDVACK